MGRLGTSVVVLGLVACLDGASALRRAGPSDLERHDAAEGGGVGRGASAVVLVVGRTLALPDGKLEATDGGTVFAAMAGEGDGAEVVLAEKPQERREHHHHHVKVDRHCAENIAYGVEHAWPLFKEHVLESIRSSLGSYPDVVVCADSIVGTLPPEVTRVVNVSTTDQFERARLCYEAVVALRPYDLYIKTRPDFVFLGDLPDVAAMRPDCIHTRFRHAIGIAGLTSSHFSWDQCNHKCNGMPKTAVGYINDDMIWVVPSAVAAKVFAADSADGHWQDHLRMPPRWLVAPDTLELAFTKRLIGAGVVTEPLAVAGYPLNCRFNHKQSASPCAKLPVAKDDCGEQRPMREVQELLRQ